MSAKDVQFLEGLFLTAPANKYVCPICLCAVQREAFLTQCCGSHFCKQCISRIVDSGKPCPLCETLPLVVFPNKERQREINSLPVCCPVSLLEKDQEPEENADSKGPSVKCSWKGELGHVKDHLKAEHKDDKRCKMDDNSASNQDTRHQDNSTEPHMRSRARTHDQGQKHSPITSPRDGGNKKDVSSSSSSHKQLVFAAAVVLLAVVVVAIGRYGSDQPLSPVGREVSEEASQTEPLLPPETLPPSQQVKPLSPPQILPSPEPTKPPLIVAKPGGGCHGGHRGHGCGGHGGHHGHHHGHGGCHGHGRHRGHHGRHGHKHGGHRGHHGHRGHGRHRR